MSFRASAARWLADGAVAGTAPAVPSAERSPGAGRSGEPCGRGDAAFAQWSCGPGLHCAAGADHEVGACVPDAVQVGSPCDVGAVNADPDPHRDGRRGSGKTPCQRGGFCESAFAGFPGGSCAGPCAPEDPRVACAAIPMFATFNACLARGRPFAQCAADNHNKKAMPACSEAAPCRDDYVCAPSRAGGVCMPPYFFLQLRVDGPRRVSTN